jgi:branched-chain amino acid transport system permease protein
MLDAFAPPSPPAVRTDTPRLGSWIALACVVAALALLPILAQALDQPFLVRVLSRIFVFAVAAVSLSILLGHAGLISVMHAALLGFGGYTVAILANHVDEPLLTWPFTLRGTRELLLAAPIAIAATALLSAVLALVALRTRGAYFIMITLAFNQMLYYLFISLDKYGGDEGLQVSSPLRLGGAVLNDRTTVYYICLASLVLTLLLASRLLRSRFGTVIRAAAGNERRVASVGIHPVLYQWAALVITGALAGLAGVLLVLSQEFVSPADMAWTRSGELIVMVVLGGTAAIWGPVVGAAVFLLLELMLSGMSVHWQLAFGTLIILMVAFMRTGIVGTVESLKRGLRRSDHE